jgi:ABC-type multidrug transport system fused ATPase/permease subunit
MPAFLSDKQLNLPQNVGSRMLSAETKSLMGFIMTGLGERPRQKIALLLTIALVGAGMSAMLPLVFGRFVDIVEERSMEPAVIAFVAAVYCLFFVANGVLGELRSLIFGFADNTSFQNLSNEAYLRALHMPYDYHIREETGVTWERIDMGAEAGSELLNEGLGGVIPYAIQIVFSLLVLSYLYGLWMSAILSAMIIGFLVISYVGTSRMKVIQKDIIEHQSSAVATAIDTLQSIETINALSVAREVAASFKNAMSLYWKSVRRYMVTRFALGAGGQVFTALAMFLAFLVPLAHDGPGFGVSDYVIINMTLLQLAIPLEGMTKNYFSVVDAIVRLRRLSPFLEAQVESLPSSMEGQVNRPLVARSICLERDGRKIISGVSVSISSGQTVAIVGQSGAGKSTLCHMLCGVVSPSTGEVVLGERLLHELTPLDRQRSFGLVPQSVPILDGSLLHNVALGRTASEDRPFELLKSVGLSDLLSRVEGDLSVDLGDGGLRVSGGEAQRIGLARALYRDPAILLLDEATASLDSLTEQSIFDLLKARSLTKTTIIVTHKLSLIDWVDEILFLENGRIAEQGTHDALRSLGGSYAALWSNQASSK